jgi:capsule polysaccharide export protein KpsE/RkpR
MTDYDQLPPQHPLVVEVERLREELAQAMQIISGEGLGESLLAAEAEVERLERERDEALRGIVPGPLIYGSEAKKVQAEVKRLREALERIESISETEYGDGLIEAQRIARSALADERKR